MKKLLVLALTLTGMSLFGMEQTRETIPFAIPGIGEGKVITLQISDKQIVEISDSLIPFIGLLKNLQADMGEAIYTEPIPLLKVDNKMLLLILHSIETFFESQGVITLLQKDSEFFTKYTPTDTPALLRTTLEPLLKNQDLQKFINAADFLQAYWLTDAATAIQNKAPQVYSIADLVALRQLPTITQGKLNLSHKNLVSAVGIALIPEIKTVTQLNLDFNDLQSLPDTIGKLQRLTALYLNRNQLQSLPATIGNLQTLTRLYLNFNQLQSLPNTIGNLQNLKEFSLNFNQLRSLPATIGNLQNLTRLSLYSNQLQSLPDTIGNLQTLNWLSLDSNQLQSLPDTIGNLQTLNWLGLDSNQLQSLPITIGNLQNLNTLTLGKNLLSDATNQFLNQLQQQHPDLKIYMDE